MMKIVVLLILVQIVVTVVLNRVKFAKFFYDVLYFFRTRSDSAYLYHHDSYKWKYIFYWSKELDRYERIPVVGDSALAYYRKLLKEVEHPEWLLLARQCLVIFPDSMPEIENETGIGAIYYYESLSVGDTDYVMLNPLTGFYHRASFPGYKLDYVERGFQDIINGKS